MTNFRYSNYPIEAYKLHGVPRDEVAVITEVLEPHQRVPAWNMMWLSAPKLDRLPGVGQHWHRHYTVTPGLLQSIVFDIADIPDLITSLTQHPLTFEQWFVRQNHTDFRTYHAAGQNVWVKTVSERCEMAAEMTIVPVRVTARPSGIKISCGG